MRYNDEREISSFERPERLSMETHVYSTMTEAMEALRRQGFTADFTLCKETGRITATGASFKGEELKIVEHHRFEGISDPDDSSVLYALETVDGVKGLLIDAYGTYADPRIGAVLKNTSDEHSE
jgi:hypothetical protein